MVSVRVRADAVVNANGASGTHGTLRTGRHASSIAFHVSTARVTRRIVHLMSVTCPNCQAKVLHRDKFCPACGQPITLKDWPSDDFVPLPGVTSQPDTRTRKRRRSRRRWYRRPLWMALLIFSALLVIGAAGAALYIQNRFGDINEISTPPPVVSGSVFGAPDGEVNTGPAQQVLDLAGSGEGGEFILEGSDPLADGTAPAASPASEIATPEGDGTGGRDFPGLASPSATPTSEPTPTPATNVRLNPVLDPEDGSRTILLVSVDAPEGEPIDTGVRPDQIAVLHFDGDSGVCRVLSIPTGMRTTLPGYGESRINNALALGGIRYEILVVEQMLGLKIDHFGLIDWASVDGLVDAMGGVMVDNPEAFEAEGFTFDEGEIELDGEQALVYSRQMTSEEEEAESSEDLAETRRNQVLRGLIAQTGGVNVVRKAPDVLGALEGHIKSDLKATQMLGLVNDYRTNCTSETLETGSLAGELETHEDPIVKDDITYTVVPQEEIDRRLDWLIEGVDPTGTPVATPD